MNVKECFKPTGKVTISIIQKDTNQIVEQFENHNLVVKSGRSEIAKLLAGQSSKLINKMAIGKGGADLVNAPYTPIAPVDGDTGLYNQVSIIAISQTTVTTTGTNPKTSFIGLFDCDVVNSLVNECGLMFNDSSTMFARYTFKTTPLMAGDGFTMKITWEIEF